MIAFLLLSQGQSGPLITDPGPVCRQKNPENFLKRLIFAALNYFGMVNISLPSRTAHTHLILIIEAYETLHIFRNPIVFQEILFSRTDLPLVRNRQTMYNRRNYRLNSLQNFLLSYYHFD